MSKWIWGDREEVLFKLRKKCHDLNGIKTKVCVWCDKVIH